jgi:hypothetical protein
MFAIFWDANPICWQVPFISGLFFSICKPQNMAFDGNKGLAYMRGTSGSDRYLSACDILLICLFLGEKIGTG